MLLMIKILNENYILLIFACMVTDEDTEKGFFTIQCVSTGLKTSNGATEKVHLKLCALPRINFYNFCHVCFQIQRRHICYNEQ